MPRADLTYTGDYYSNIFNRSIYRIQGYAVVNIQMQLNAPDDRFYVRGFVQNLLNNNAITGLAVADQSAALFTSAFTLEPRRYGIAAGSRFCAQPGTRAPGAPPAGSPRNRRRPG